MKRAFVISLVVVVVILATMGSVLAASKTVFKADLEPPSVMGSDAHGNAVFVYSDDGSQMTYKLVVNGLGNTTMAHIHVSAAPGGDGPPAVWLYPQVPPFQPTEIPGVFNGLLGSRTVTSADLVNQGGTGVSTLEQLRVAIEEGRAYVNVHTVANPGGEIRGQLQ